MLGDGDVAVASWIMGSAERDSPEVQRAKFELRLHSSGRPWDVPAQDVDWDATAVGKPVQFEAVVIPAAGLWVPKGRVDIRSPVDLEMPTWTVRRSPQRRVPVAVGKVGWALAAGQSYSLPLDGWIAVRERV
jgi:hypothetical protein